MVNNYHILVWTTLCACSEVSILYGSTLIDIRRGLASRILSIVLSTRIPAIGAALGDLFPRIRSMVQCVTVTATFDNR
jgi:hypothetical protein